MHYGSRGTATHGMRPPTISKPLDVFEENLGDAEALLRFVDGFRNIRSRRMRSQIRESIGAVLRLSRKDRAALDRAESAHVYAVLLPGSPLNRSHFTDEGLRPLLRQSVVAISAAVETYVADRAVEFVGAVLKNPTARLANVHLDLKTVIEIDAKYTRRGWGYREALVNHIRQEASPAPSKVGYVFALVGQPIKWATVDKRRGVPTGSSERDLLELYAKRNHIAHQADRKGRSRRVITVEEVHGYHANARAVVEAIDVVLASTAKDAGRGTAGPQSSAKASSPAATQRGAADLPAQMPDQRRFAGSRQSGGEVDAVVTHASRLGPPASWDEPLTYGALPLAVLDSVWSIGVRYTGVLNVIARYRQLRAQQGVDADTETSSRFSEGVDALGGPEAFADAVNNHQRTSARSGILKAEAVARQVQMLAAEGMETTGALMAASLTRRMGIQQRWMGEVPGQSSGLSWEYFLMLLGLPGVKADRMVRRFVADALAVDEVAVTEARANGLVRAAADQLRVDPRFMDYAIWQYQRVVT